LSIKTYCLHHLVFLFSLLLSCGLGFGPQELIVVGPVGKCCI
jgi:hypothetical protein